MKGLGGYIPITISYANATPKSNVSGIQTTLSNLWKNTGVKIGVGLGATALGIFGLSSATQEATKPLGEFGGISGSLLFLVVIGVILLMVIRK